MVATRQRARKQWWSCWSNKIIWIKVVLVRMRGSDAPSVYAFFMFRDVCTYRYDYPANILMSFSRLINVVHYEPNRKLTNRNLSSASLGVRFILSSIWGNRGAEMKVFLRSFFKQMIKRRQIDVEATEGKCKDWDLNSHVPAERRVLPLHHWIEEPLTCQVDLYHVLYKTNVQ